MCADVHRKRNWMLGSMSNEKESHVLQSLQDFVRNIGIPPNLKKDNARTQTSNEWTGFERKLCANGLTKEPRSPWKNMSDHSIGDLGVIAQRNMKQFNVPMNQYHWCMKWCKDVHDVLSMEKLKWRTPKEMLIGDTPDTSMFKCRTWGNS